MLVFITHPKYFDRKEIIGKKLDLVYVFNSKSTFKKFDEKCVNIGLDGEIKNENFFPKMSLNLQKIEIFKFKLSVYKYFNKVVYSHRKKFIMNSNLEYSVVSIANRYLKQDLNLAITFIEGEIDILISEVLSFYEIKNKLHISKLYHIYDSFFKSYVYSLGFKRGAEIFADVFKYNLFLNTIIHYKFDKFDLYRDFFHFNYLKVLSRLFIEKIHKSNVKNFIEQNIKFYKEK